MPLPQPMSMKLRFCRTGLALWPGKPWHPGNLWRSWEIWVWKGKESEKVHMSSDPINGLLKGTTCDWLGLRSDRIQLLIAHLLSITVGECWHATFWNMKHMALSWFVWQFLEMKLPGWNSWLIIMLWKTSINWGHLFWETPKHSTHPHACHRQSGLPRHRVTKSEPSETQSTRMAHEEAAARKDPIFNLDWKILKVHAPPAWNNLGLYLNCIELWHEAKTGTKIRSFGFSWTQPLTMSWQ